MKTYILWTVGILAFLFDAATVGMIFLIAWGVQ